MRRRRKFQEILLLLYRKLYEIYANRQKNRLRRVEKHIFHTKNVLKTFFFLPLRKTPFRFRFVFLAKSKRPFRFRFVFLAKSKRPFRFFPFLLRFFFVNTKRKTPMPARDRQHLPGEHEAAAGNQGRLRQV